MLTAPSVGQCCWLHHAQRDLSQHQACWHTAPVSCSMPCLPTTLHPCLTSDPAEQQPFHSWIFCRSLAVAAPSSQALLSQALLSPALLPQAELPQALFSQVLFSQAPGSQILLSQPLFSQGSSGEAGTSTVVRLDQASQSFTFTEVAEQPVLSVLRNFSAPITLRVRLTRVLGHAETQGSRVQGLGVRV